MSLIKFWASKSSLTRSIHGQVRGFFVDDSKRVWMIIS